MSFCITPYDDSHKPQAMNTINTTPSAVRPPLCEEVLEEVRGGGGGLGGEVGEGGVVLHQHTHHLPELLWGEPRLSLTDKDNVTDGG